MAPLLLRIAARRGALALVVACLAGPAASVAAAASEPFDLVPGEAVVVKGSSLNCVVSQTSGSPITLVCGEGSVIGQPADNTYAFGLADSAALLLKSSSKGKPERVQLDAQPTLPAGTFAGPKGKSPASLRLGYEQEFAVAGTRVLCAVTRTNGAPSLTCGLAGSTTFVVGSVVAFISAKDVVLSRYEKGGAFERLKLVAQPRR